MSYLYGDIIMEPQKMRTSEMGIGFVVGLIVTIPIILVDILVPVV